MRPFSDKHPRPLSLLVAVLPLLLLLLLTPAAHAAAPHTIDFDDATGIITDDYYDGGALDGVRFERSEFAGFDRVASAGAASAPNVAAIPFFPAPRARQSKTVLSGTSSGTIDFPFTHTSVAMTVGRPGSAGDAGTLTLTAYDAGGGVVTSRSVVVPAGSKATLPLAVSSFFSNISSVSLQGDGGGYVIDDFTYDVPDTPPPPDYGFSWVDRALTTETIGPGQSIDVPLALTRVNKSSGPISFTASNLPAGVTASFSPNPATDPTQKTTETMHLTAANNALPANQQKVVVTASPSSTAGGTNRSVTVPVTVKAQFDLQARGLEITQGIQPGGPGQGLPQVDTGNGTASYRGVRLTAFGYKPTIVRFYAGAAGAPAGGVGAEATLEGFRDGRPLPGSPLHPDGGGLLIDQGYGGVSYSERLDDIHPFNFTIPPSWQDGHISIVGHVSLPPVLFGGSTQECANCGGNNTTTLNDIGFTQEAVDSVDPVKVVYSDRTKPGAPFVQPPESDWWSAFQAAKKVDPIDILPHYWRGTIDVTTHKEFHGFKGWVTRSFINSNDIERNDKSSEVLDDLDDWADDYADVNWPVGIIHRFNLYDGNTEDLGSSHGGPLNQDRPTAVVSPDRPLGSVAHELGHNLGRQHASAGCGGGADGQKAEGWPDPYGYIEGVGVDLTQPASDGGQYKIIGGDMGASGADCVQKQMPPDCGGKNPPQPFDYMSYCANEANAWISGIGWDEIINAYNLGSRARARVASAAAVKRSGVKVRGYVTSTGAQITDVEKGKFAATKAPSGSTFSLEATNASGKVLSTKPMAVVSGHTDAAGGAQPTLSFEGTVPAGSAASVRVLRQGTSIARRDRSAHAPKVRITAPKARSVVGRKKTVFIKWKASDADKTPVDISVDYSANGGKTYHRIYMGPNRGNVGLPRNYFSHARKARVRVTADDGFNQTTATSKVFRSLGAPPIVRLNAPLKGTVKVQNATLLLSGFALDDTNKRLKGKRLTWYYAGRVVAHGENTSVAGMLAGKHTVKLVARDSSGHKASSSVNVRLIAVQPSFKKVKAPKKVSRKAKKVTLKLSSSVDVPLKIGKQRFTVHQGLTTVKVKVKPGRSKLTFDLVIGSGKLTAKRTVTVKRG